MANERRTLLRLVGDSQDARRAVNEVRSDLRRMSREEATVRLDIQTARIERSIERVKAQLESLGKQKPSLAVDLKTTAANERLKLLEFRLDRLSLKRVNIDVDIKRGGIERTAAALGAVERGVSGVTRGVGSAARAVPIFGQIFGTVLNGAVSLVSTLATGLGSLVTAGLETVVNTFKNLSGLGALAGPIGGVVASLVGMVAQFVLLAAVGGAVVIALNAVLGAIIALSGALVALVASLTAALGGLAAMAVAFGGVLLPVIAVAIGLFTRFAAIIKARQAREQELAGAVQAQKTAEQQRKTALDESRAAHERLAEATVEGNRAMQQSAVDLRDAELGLEGSQLGVKEARLNLAEAKRALRELRQEKQLQAKSLDPLFKRATDVTADPAQQRAAIGDIRSQTKGKVDPLELQKRILAVQRAQLGVKDSINATAHAEQTLADATKKRADFVKEGLNAYKPYRTALEGVRRSEQRLQRAQEQTSIASRKYDRALKNLSGTERGTLDRVNKLIKGFTALAKAFTDPIFRAANEVFDSLSGKAGFLKDSLKLVGTAMGDALRQFGRFLAQPQTIAAFQTMATGAANLVRILAGSAFTHFLTIMREIAVAALPAVTGAARSLDGWLGRIAGQPGRIHRAVGTLIGQFRVWAALTGSVFGLVKDLFGVAAPAGASLATSMRHVVDHWREWIRANPEKVREFFRTSVRRTKDIIRGLASIFRWLRDDLPRAAKVAKTGFEAVWKVVKRIVDGVRWLQNASTDVANTLGVGASPSDAANVAKNDLAIVKSGLADLKRHLSPTQRTTIRQQVIDALQELLGNRGSVGRQIHLDNRGQLEKILSQLLSSTARGAPRSRAPSTRGDGRSPDARGASTIVNHFHIPRPLDATKPIDAPHTAKLLQLAWESGGGGLS